MKTSQARTSLAAPPTQENRDPLREYDFRKRRYVDRKRRSTLASGSDLHRAPLSVVTNLANDTRNSSGRTTGSGTRTPSGLPADPNNNGPKAKLFVKGHGAVTEYIGKAPFRPNNLNSKPVEVPNAGPSRLPARPPTPPPVAGPSRLPAQPPTLTPTPPLPVLRSILKDSNVTIRQPRRSRGNPDRDVSRVHFSPNIQDLDETDNTESEGAQQLQVPTPTTIVTLTRISPPPNPPTTEPTPTTIQSQRLWHIIGHTIEHIIEIVSDVIFDVSLRLLSLWALLILLKWLLNDGIDHILHSTSYKSTQDTPTTGVFSLFRIPRLTLLYLHTAHAKPNTVTNIGE
ncbi:hypothetical protein NLI96_g1620 [Meripilus lineatus]|uniref:Uncharacterized protein n=1 Tax=Meripilus lineatus TaxID=2056292 RepID=A0AAD5VA91_9APHY|nr:hypothetical protein NLI96_g1620 [Physisporinus lineatus]